MPKKTEKTKKELSFDVDVELEPTLAVSLESVDENTEDEVEAADEVEAVEAESEAPKKVAKPRAKKTPAAPAETSEIEWTAREAAQAQLRAWQDAQKVAQAMSVQFAEVLSLVDEARERAQKAELQLAKVSAQRGSRSSSFSLGLAVVAVLVSVFSLTLSQSARQELVAFTSAQETVAPKAAEVAAPAPVYAAPRATYYPQSAVAARPEAHGKVRSRTHMR